MISMKIIVESQNATIEYPFTAHCQPGRHYDAETSSCVACPRNGYQPLERQNACRRCPGNTIADATGSTDSQQCKGTLPAFRRILVKKNYADIKFISKCSAISSYSASKDFS